MIGTPDEVIERLRHYEALGVDEFSFWSDNSLTHEEKASPSSCSSRRSCRLSGDAPWLGSAADDVDSGGRRRTPS